MLTDFHAAQGARPAPPGAPLPILTHSSPPEEYRAATQSWALFDRGPLDRVLVSGPDAGAFFTRILSCDVRRLEPGQGTRGMLLTSKGKVQELFDLLCTAAGFEITLPPGRAASLLQGLDMYHFGEDLVTQDQSGTHATFDALGPQAATSLAAALNVEIPKAPHTAIEFQKGGQPWRLTTRTIAGVPGLRLEGDANSGKEMWSGLLQAGATPAGLVAFDSLRAETVSGLFGIDITDTIYPQEARLEDAFSLEKGCYIGQEVVAKIDTYGGLNKRLMLLEVSDDDPVPPGTRLLQPDANREKPPRDLGVTTSWAYSFARDKGVVLAYVKRKHQAPGTTLHLGDSPRTATLTDR